MAILIGFGFPAVLFFTVVEPAGAAMIHTMQRAPAMYGSTLSPHEWSSMVAQEVQKHAQATTNTVDPVVCALLIACVLTLAVMLMIKYGPKNSIMMQRGRLIPEPRNPNDAEAIIELFRQVTLNLGREPTLVEFDEIQRRRADDLFTIEHGFSPLSPNVSPHQSPIVVTDSDDDQPPLRQSSFQCQCTRRQHRNMPQGRRPV
jgi:hypothetical protein